MVWRKIICSPSRWKVTLPLSSLAHQQISSRLKGRRGGIQGLQRTPTTYPCMYVGQQLQSANRRHCIIHCTQGS